MVPRNHRRIGSLSGAAELRFWKVEAIGNDFPLVHLADVSGDELPELAKKMCDRHFGIGGDGLLALGMEGPYPRLRMFNPDGTEDFCGNGLRCAAIHAHRLGWVDTDFKILHLGKSVRCLIEGESVTTFLGSASYRPADVPTKFESDPENGFDRVVWNDGTREIRGSSLTTGSTHTVIPGPLPDDEEFGELGPLLELAPQFPARTSVIWAEALAPMVLSVRIWERGVGETQGCGTGSSAAAMDYLRRIEGSGTVEVRNPGGTVWVSADRWDGPIAIKGGAKEIYSGVWQG